MKCPYCETENPDDAQECSNCAADLGSLFKGTPPPESYAPTMMTSSAEVAAMLAAARGESEPEPETSPEPPPDYAAPTMMTSSAEIASMLASARGETPAGAEMPEAPMEETPAEVFPMDEPAVEEPMMEAPAVEEAPMEISEVPMGDPGAYAPTMISAVPDEVAEVIAAAKASEQAVEVPAEEPAAPTFVGIPDPLGVSDSGKFIAPEPEPVIPPPPAYQEPAITPPPASTPDAPKKDDTRKWWIIGGVGCVTLCCLCSFVGIAINVFNAVMSSR